LHDAWKNDDELAKTEEERKRPTKGKETKQNRRAATRTGVKTTARNEKQQDWGSA